MFSVKFDKSGGVRVSTMASVSACWRIYTSNCNLKAKTYTRLANWETVSKMSCPINPFFFGDRSRFLDWVWVKAVWDRASTLFKISQDILNTVIGILDEPLKSFCAGNLRRNLQSHTTPFSTDRNMEISLLCIKSAVSHNKTRTPQSPWGFGNYSFIVLAINFTVVFSMVLISLKSKPWKGCPHRWLKDRWLYIKWCISVQTLSCTWPHSVFSNSVLFNDQNLETFPNTSYELCLFTRISLSKFIWYKTQKKTIFKRWGKF